MMIDYQIELIREIQRISINNWLSWKYDNGYKYFFTLKHQPNPNIF